MSEEQAQPINQCERCMETFAVDRLTWVVTARPGGHTLPSLTAPKTGREFTLPSSQKVCFDCLTDLEVVLMLRPLIVWFLDATIKEAAESGSDYIRGTLSALETIKATHTVRIHDPSHRDGRAFVSRVLRGLANTYEEENEHGNDSMSVE